MAAYEAKMPPTVRRRNTLFQPIDGEAVYTTQIEHLASLDYNVEPPKEYRRSPIICTIGPVTNSPEMLLALRNAGMNCVRMNFSHGDYEYHQSVIDNTKKSFELQDGRPVAIALDTKGPEIRTGVLKDGEIKLEVGKILTVTTDTARQMDGDSETIWFSYENICNVIEVGSIIYIDDGLISMKVVEIAEDKRSLKVEVVNPGRTGILENRKGVNLPNTDVDLPALSEKDKKDLRFGVKNKVDIVFASFVRSGADIEAYRSVLGEDGKHIQIISKIENHEGMRNFDEILKESDGIMVARGDLGIEIEPEKVFLAQKVMISKCNMAGKPVIVATQMLDSMIFNPRPTRAEVNDVGSAILDGSDCVMLSGESAKGKYPVQAVEMMARISCVAESALNYQHTFDELRTIFRKNMTVSTSEVIAEAAVEASYQHPEIRGIIVLSISGNTARLVAKYRPACPVVSVSRNGRVARQLNMTRGVFGVHYSKDRDDDWEKDMEDRFEFGFAKGAEQGILKKGDRVVLLQGFKSGSGHTNTMRILTLGE